MQSLHFMHLLFIMLRSVDVVSCLRWGVIDIWLGIIDLLVGIVENTGLFVELKLICWILRPVSGILLFRQCVRCQQAESWGQKVGGIWSRLIAQFVVHHTGGISWLVTDCVIVVGSGCESRIGTGLRLLFVAVFVWGVVGWWLGWCRCCWRRVVLKSLALRFCVHDKCGSTARYRLRIRKNLTEWPTQMCAFRRTLQAPQPKQCLTQISQSTVAIECVPPNFMQQSSAFSTKIKLKYVWIGSRHAKQLVLHKTLKK